MLKKELGPHMLDLPDAGSLPTEALMIDPADPNAPLATDIRSVSASLPTTMAAMVSSINHIKSADTVREAFETLDTIIDGPSFADATPEAKRGTKKAITEMVINAALLERAYSGGDFEVNDIDDWRLKIEETKDDLVAGKGPQASLQEEILDLRFPSTLSHEMLLSLAYMSLDKPENVLAAEANPVYVMAREEMKGVLAAMPGNLNVELEGADNLVKAKRKVKPRERAWKATHLLAMTGISVLSAEVLLGQRLKALTIDKANDVLITGESSFFGLMNQSTAQWLMDNPEWRDFAVQYGLAGVAAPLALFALGNNTARSWIDSFYNKTKSLIAAKDGEEEVANDYSKKARAANFKTVGLLLASLAAAYPLVKGAHSGWMESVMAAPQNEETLEKLTASLDSAQVFLAQIPEEIRESVARTTSGADDWLRKEESTGIGPAAAASRFVLTGDISEYTKWKTNPGAAAVDQGWPASGAAAKAAPGITASVDQAVQVQGFDGFKPDSEELIRYVERRITPAVQTIEELKAELAQIDPDSESAKGELVAIQTRLVRVLRPMIELVPEFQGNLDTLDNIYQNIFDTANSAILAAYPGRPTVPAPNIDITLDGALIEKVVADIEATRDDFKSVPYDQKLALFKQALVDELGQAAGEAQYYSIETKAWGLALGEALMLILTLFEGYLVRRRMKKFGPDYNPTYAEYEEIVREFGRQHGEAISKILRNGLRSYGFPEPKQTDPSEWVNKALDQMRSERAWPSMTDWVRDVKNYLYSALLKEALPEASAHRRALQDFGNLKRLVTAVDKNDVTALNGTDRKRGRQKTAKVSKGDVLPVRFADEDAAQVWLAKIMPNIGVDLVEPGVEDPRTFEALTAQISSLAPAETQMLNVREERDHSKKSEAREAAIKSEIAKSSELLVKVELLCSFLTKSEHENDPLVKALVLCKEEMTKAVAALRKVSIQNRPDQSGFDIKTGLSVQGWSEARAQHAGALRELITAVDGVQSLDIDLDAKHSINIDPRIGVPALQEALEVISSEDDKLLSEFQAYIVGDDLDDKDELEAIQREYSTYFIEKQKLERVVQAGNIEVTAADIFAKTPFAEIVKNQAQQVCELFPEISPELRGRLTELV